MNNRLPDMPNEFVEKIEGDLDKAHEELEKLFDHVGIMFWDYTYKEADDFEDEEWTWSFSAQVSKGEETVKTDERGNWTIDTPWEAIVAEVLYVWLDCTEYTPEEEAEYDKWERKSFKSN